MHRTTGTPALRRWLVGGASLVLAATMVGCGSDDDSGDTASSATSAAAEADPAEFCEAAVDAEAAIATGPPIDFETATPEEIQAALEEFGAQVEPQLADVEETAPEEISDDVTHADRVRSGRCSRPATTPSSSSPSTPRRTTPSTSTCSPSAATSRSRPPASNYEYEGIPDTVPSGVVAITFTNEGDELHEIGVARINDDVTSRSRNCSPCRRSRSSSMIEFKGAAFAAPGESDTVFMRLEPGRYGAACFIPQGTTHDTEGSGPPHFTLGMFAEFTAE